jgi:hypothetical protein
MRTAASTVERVVAHAFRIPTEEQESDATLAWDATTPRATPSPASSRAGPPST